LIPAVPEIVLDVDVTARRIVIRPPEGLLEL
jgi:ribosomal 30S subunit maturation factor RimM